MTLLSDESGDSARLRARHIWVQALPQPVTGGVTLSKLQKIEEPFQVQSGMNNTSPEANEIIK